MTIRCHENSAFSPAVLSRVREAISVLRLAYIPDKEKRPIVADFLLFAII